MKVIICFILFFLILKNTLIADDFKIPFKKENLKAIYKIDDGNWIYIQSFERGDRIWERKKNSDDINQIIDYVSETLKKKLAHETTIKLKELYPNLDEDKIEKLNKLFKEN